MKPIRLHPEVRFSEYLPNLKNLDFSPLFQILTSTHLKLQKQGMHHLILIMKPLLIHENISWGEFEIQIRITFVPESGEKAMVIYHHLKLHPWTPSGEPEIPPPDVAIKLGPVHSWQYDEIVFNDPYQNFLNLLTQNPPTALPKATRKPVPFNLANPGSLEASRGGVPEFTSAMEKEEGDRLEEARKTVIAEQDRWRTMLFDKEKELDRLQKEIDALG